MGNSLNQDIDGKVVVLKAEDFKPEYQDVKYRLFKVEGGFGSSPITSGRALFGKYLINGQGCREDGYGVDRLATEEDMKSLETGR